jgi:hypothetical protein
MGWVEDVECSRENRGAYNILMERNHFGDQNVEGRAVLKWTLLKSGMKT